MLLSLGGTMRLPSGWLSHLASWGLLWSLSASLVSLMHFVTLPHGWASPRHLARLGCQPKDHSCKCRVGSPQVRAQHACWQPWWLWDATHHTDYSHFIYNVHDFDGCNMSCDTHITIENNISMEFKINVTTIDKKKLADLYALYYIVRCFPGLKTKNFSVRFF